MCRSNFYGKRLRLSQTDFEYSSIFVIVEEDKAELLSTEDFLVIDALYHKRPLNEKMQSRLNRLIEMGIVEHIGRKKYVLAQKSLCGNGQNRCAYKARRFGSRYQQGAAAKAHPPEQRSWYSVQRIAASFAWVLIETKSMF